MPPSSAATQTGRVRKARNWLFPPRGRFFRRWTDWLPLPLTVVLLSGLLAGVVWLPSHIGCRSGLLPSASRWSQGNECVGVSDGPYAFGRTELASVMARIAEQNRDAQNSCGTPAAPVTVGAMLTLTAPNSGSRALHELEGIAAAQAAANNKKPCNHPIRLRVAQMGAAEQAATRVAQTLADSPDIVAVVGLGLSDQRSADAVELLAAPGRGVPMVAERITAEGFDKNGSSADEADFSDCDPRDAYTHSHGIGEGFFRRVSFNVAAQVKQIGLYLAGRSGKLDFVVTPTTRSDPYTCTLLPLIHRQLGQNVSEVRFDPADPTTVTQSAKRICDPSKPVTVFYAARARDLGRFLASIDDETTNGYCKARTITVVSTSDAARIRVPESDLELEGNRLAVLASRTFKSNGVQLIYTPLADPDILAKSPPPGFTRLLGAFKSARFALADLDDGWAITGYDALTTVAAALNSLNTRDSQGNLATVTRSQVDSAIGNIASTGTAVPGAEGDLTFDGAGNRDGSPVVVRACPMAAAGATRTVEVYPLAESCP